MRPLRLALACSLLSAAAACNAIFGIQPGMNTSSSTSSGSGGGSGGATTSSSSSGASATASSAASTTSASSGSGTGGSGGAPACPAAKVPACHVDGGVGAVCEPVLLTPAPYDGYAIGLTVVGDTVYWASGDGRITFGPDQGGVSPGPFGMGDDSVQVATDGTRIYWTDYYDGVIRSATLDAAHTLADVTSVVGDPDAGIVPRAPMSRIVVQDGMLYWSTENPNAVWAALANGTQTFPTKVADKVDGASSTDVSIGVAADATHVYWTDADKVRRLPLGMLGDATKIEDFATNAGAGEVVLDADRVYWTTDTGVSSMHRDASGLITLPSTGTERARSLLLDGAYVYWSTAGGSIRRAQRGGGMSTVTVISQGTPEAFMLAADCGAIYWSTFAYDHGRVFKVLKPL